MSTTDIAPPRTLAIALGANTSSKLGPPATTLREVRPQIERTICLWLGSLLKEKKSTELIYTNLRWRWSPLFRTKPIGGPKEQSAYINAVLIVDGAKLSSLKPSTKAALVLLERFL